MVAIIQATMSLLLAFVAGGAAEAVATALVHHFIGHRARPTQVALDDDTKDLIERSISAHNHHLTERIREEIRRHHNGGGGYVR